MAQGMAAGLFVDARTADGDLDRLLHGPRQQMVATLDVGARVLHRPGRGEQILPGQFNAGVGVFAFEGKGKVNACELVGPVEIEQVLHLA